MKKSKTYLRIAILLLLAFIVHVFIFLNAKFTFFTQDIATYLYIGIGVIILVCDVICFIRYGIEKKRIADDIQKAQDIESLNEVLNEAAVSGHLEENTENEEKEAQTTRKKRKPPPVDFNQLEEDLLTATKMESLFELATKWIFTYLDVSYIAFSNVTTNEKLSIESYNENVPSEVYLVEAVAERMNNLEYKGTVDHDGHTLSVPYFLKGSIFGFLFLGAVREDENFLPVDMSLIGPFIRIFSTACLVIELARMKEQRSSLQKAFSSYVPSAIVDSFEHDPSVLKIGGEYENLTIMFTDLKGFTTLSETMSPDNLITVLNEYFSEMSGVIEAFGGTVSKLVGDGILAFFGGPNSPPNHAEKCCEAALTMKKYEAILNTKLISSGKIKMPLFTRVGISSGKVILGNIGSEKRLDYTVMGPEVNLASRIEAANKNCGTAILISYETFLIVRNTFNCRRAAFMKLKGFSKSVYLFELVDKLKSASEEKILLANDLADLLGVKAENLLSGTSTDTKKVATPVSVQVSDEDLEEFEDADDVEELEEL